MKQALFAVGVMAIAVPAIQASIIVLGDGPFGMLIDAHLDVPQNPNSNPVSQMVAYRHYTDDYLACQYTVYRLPLLCGSL